MTTDGRQARPFGFWPFVVVATFGQLSLGWPFFEVQRPTWAMASTALFAVVLAIVLLLHWMPPRQLRGHSFVALPAFAFLVQVAVLRHADGGWTSGFMPMLALPVLWLALHGTRRQVWLSVAGVAAVLLLPVLLIGPPDYPLTDWRRVVLWIAISALMGPLTHHLVRERVSAEAQVLALEPSQARLHAILRAATGHSVIATDLDGVITVFNPGAEAMLGWTAEEMVGRRTPEVLHDAGEVVTRASELGIEPGFQVFVHAADQGGSETRDWTYVHRDGHRLTVSLTVSGVRDSADRLTGYIGIATDVTDVRRAHAELHAQQVLHKLLIGNLPDTIVGMLDSDLAWVTLGGQWMEEHGLHEADMVGRRPGDSMPMVNPDALRAFFRAGLTRPMHGDFATRDDSWFEINAVPVDGPDGDRLVLVVSQDVTDRRRAEAMREEMMIALGASEEKFRSTFEDAPIGIALRTVSRDPDDTRFVQANRAFGQILGVDPESLAGTRFRDLVHPEDRAHHEDSSLTRGRSQQLRMRHSSGRWVWVEVTSSVVRDAAGVTSYAVTQVVDVTARRASETALLDALEQQRAASEGLREVDRVRTEVMATISHELRTPLTSIGGYLDLLAEGDGGELNEMQTEMVEIALRNADRLAALIEDLLVLSRLDASEPGAQPAQQIEVNALAGTALDTFRPLVRRRDQSLELALPDSSPMVTGDPEQLDRVLVNLVTNASKYTPDGGRITVSVVEDDGWVRIEVADDGIGIPPAEQDRLFERFFRASTAHDRGIAGTGLGLAIVQSIVERHGGRITLRSAPGTGSTFTVTLPTSSTAARQRRPGAPDPLIDRSTP